MAVKQRFAIIISRVGHPINLLTAFLVFTVFSIHEVKMAYFTVGGVVLLGVFPLVVWNWTKTRKGTYTNFDVSVREDRYSMFGFIFFLSLLVILFLVWTGQPSEIITGTLVTVEMVFLAFLINFRLKISLHTAISLFIGFGFLPLSLPLAIGSFSSVPLIAWSRWLMGRHQVSELIGGAILGMFCGIQLLYLT